IEGKAQSKMMLPLFLLAALAGDPNTHTRTAFLRPDEVIEIRAQNGLVTEIQLPPDETILTDSKHGIRVGNKKFFQVNASGNTLFVEPMDDPEVGGGLRTTVNISVQTGEKIERLTF